MPESLIDIVPAAEHPDVVRWRAVARGGAVVGVAALVRPDFLLPRGPDPPELSLRVAPRWRRRAVGSRLLAAARAASPVLATDVAAGSPGEAFCRRHGFRPAGWRRHHRLASGLVHGAWLGELVDAGPPGYRLSARTTPAGVALTAATAGVALTAATVEVAGPGVGDGDPAAHSFALVDALVPSRARQYGPAVSPAHRGRRLELWVSAALIQHLRAAHPRLAGIDAVTADDDPALVAARAHLGFRPLGRTHRYQFP